jgi:hypothetical protein
VRDLGDADVGVGQHRLGSLDVVVREFLTRLPDISDFELLALKVKLDRMLGDPADDVIDHCWGSGAAIQVILEIVL